MKNTQRGLSVPHLTEEELNHAIADAQKEDETCLVRRLCFVSNLYQGDTRVEASRRVVDQEIPTRRWPRVWKTGGVDGLRPHFGGGRLPKLTPDQWNTFATSLKTVTQHSSEYSTSGSICFIEERFDQPISMSWKGESRGFDLPMEVDSSTSFDSVSVWPNKRWASVFS